MACCETTLGRIERVKKNQIVNTGSSPYDENPSPASPPGMQNAGVMPADQMTPVMTPSSGTGSGNSLIAPPSGSSSPLTPELIPDAPTFTVPANPLLPDGYREVLDYNGVQYINGFYRTQIGRFVRVEQLMGSNTIDTKEGYLIGVGINYIILQDQSTGNIQIVDIYGIKSMYVYYNYEEHRPAPAAMAQQKKE